MITDFYYARYRERAEFYCARKGEIDIGKLSVPTRQHPLR